MSYFGLDEAQVTSLVQAVTSADVDPDRVEELFARATWTGIAEPGDRTAGELISVLGAPGALTAVVEQWTSDRLVAALADGGETVTRRELDLAMARWKPRLVSSSAVNALRQAAGFSVRLLVPGDRDWPDGMADLGPHAPSALWLRGNRSTLATLDRSIALVGARAATGYGEHVTAEASAGLVDRGYTIVSGAAYGIDGMAHRAALASSGQTVAFLAGGVDRFYPSGHEGLLGTIVANGAVLSELPCGFPPTRWRFLQRNRLIAAASRATVVIEAGSRSGSLNTAGHAASLGRALGAVPGPVTSAASVGCHRLIRDFTAVCVTNADEMAELAPLDPEEIAPDGIEPEGPGAPPGARSATTPERIRVLDALSSRAPRSAADVASRAGLSVAEVQSVLGLLELEGGAIDRDRGWVKKSG
ncbi:MAG TPA: DNA-processing protein DprA [Lacisediminihabitans sp.]|uniref:DNA-processing protein DprA n=1 Tax=Lacisediminihabitans sp. TaxID=2787631 RepID=UPI002ED8A7C8